MCLRDGEETVDDNEITKYNLFTKKNKQIPFAKPQWLHQKREKISWIKKLQVYSSG